MADERLLDTSELELERELLRAAAEDCPPPSARRRGLAALGLLAVATPAAAAAPAVTGALGGSSGAGGIAGGWSTMAGWGLWQWGLVVGVGGAAIVGASALAPLAPERVTAAAPSAARAAPALSAPLPAARAPALLDEPAAEATSPAPAEPERSAATSRPRSAAPTASASRAASIRDEIDRLDRARSALGRGEPDVALTTLNEYSRRHPNGELRVEAAILRVDALRARGDALAASATARDTER